MKSSTQITKTEFLNLKVNIDLTYLIIKERRKSLGISQKKLSQLSGINESTLIRNLKKETEMSLSTYFKICLALQLRPCLIPSEDDAQILGNNAKPFTTPFVFL